MACRLRKLARNAFFRSLLSRAALFVNSDPEEKVETAIGRSLYGRRDKGPSLPSINNAGIKVTFGGLAVQGGRIRGLSGREIGSAHVRKGEKGSLVVYAELFTRSERNEESGEDIERQIPLLKAYTVFNVDQIDGLPEIHYEKARPGLAPKARANRANDLVRPESCAGA